MTILQYTFFFYLFSTAFSSLHDRFWDRRKKVLQNWWINCPLTRSISWCDSKFNRQYQINFPFFIVLGLLLFCLLLNYSAEIFLVKLLHNFSLFIYLRRGWCCFIIDNTTSKFIFCKWCINQYLFFSFSSGVFTYHLHHYLSSTYQLHYYSLTLS